MSATHLGATTLLKPFLQPPAAFYSFHETCIPTSVLESEHHSLHKVGDPKKVLHVVSTTSIGAFKIIRENAQKCLKSTLLVLISIISVKCTVRNWAHIVKMVLHKNYHVK